MFILTAFVCILVLFQYEVMAHPHGDCAKTKYISGKCGSSTTIKNEIATPEQGSLCFEVVGGDCLNPTVDVMFIGDFNSVDEYFEISYDGGEPVTCHGGDYCRSYGSCEAASALVDDLLWSDASIHSFAIVGGSEDSDFCWPGAAEAGGAWMILEVTVTCDEASCIIDELDECFCSSQIAASENNTIQALDSCFCSDEIAASQTNTIQALDSCFCSEEITASEESVSSQILTILNALNAMDTELNDKLDILLADSSDSSSSDFVMAAESIMNENEEVVGVEANDDIPKVINFTLAPSTEFSLLAMFIFMIGIAGCLIYAKYKK
jgi:hypothetical protein